MKKIIVIGCPGSGKTTFSDKLREISGIPLFYLDAIWHKSDRTHISREEFDIKLSEILASEEWIIDGNYSRTLEIRIRACDTVFLFDLPTDECLNGAIARLGKPRCDMPWTDTRLDPNLKQEIELFSRRSLPDIYKLLRIYSDNKQVIIFKTRSQADDYIKKMQTV